MLDPGSTDPNTTLQFAVQGTNYHGYSHIHNKFINHGHGKLIFTNFSVNYEPIFKVGD